MLSIEPLKEKRFKRYMGKEDNMQIATAKLLDSYTDLWFHPANERKTKKRLLKNGKWANPEGLMLQKKGVKRGVPDCWVMVPRKDFPGMVFELKAKYNKPTPEQLAWLKGLRKAGYYTFWTYSLDEVIERVAWYFSFD